MKYWIVCIGLALASCGNAQRSGEADFAADILQRVRRSVPGAVFALKPDEPLVIVRQPSKDRVEARIYLNRIYAYCRQASAEDCETTKAEFAANMATAPHRSPKPAFA